MPSFLTNTRNNQGGPLASGCGYCATSSSGFPSDQVHQDLPFWGTDAPGSDWRYTWCVLHATTWVYWRWSMHFFKEGKLNDRVMQSCITQSRLVYWQVSLLEGKYDGEDVMRSVVPYYRYLSPTCIMSNILFCDPLRVADGWPISFFGGESYTPIL